MLKQKKNKATVPTTKNQNIIQKKTTHQKQKVQAHPEQKSIHKNPYTKVRTLNTAHVIGKLQKTRDTTSVAVT